MTILQEALNNHSKKINKLEKLKREQSPLNFFAAFKEFCHAPYNSISQEQSKYLLKCFGIYDKGKDNFMLRVRIPAGQLEFYQAIELGRIAKQYGDNYIDITTRQQIELRFLNQKDLYTIVESLEKIGLSTFQTGIDNLRNIVTSSFDGHYAQNYITCKPIIDQMQNIFFKKEEYFGILPRKINTAILGTSFNDCNVFGQDCAFIAAKKFDEIGFNLYLGGKVGIQAYDANLFIKKEDVVTIYKAIIDLFKTYGFRDNRNKNRLHFLIQEVGIESFVLAIQAQAKLKLETAGELLINEDVIIKDENSVSLRNNKKAIHFPVPSGIFTGTAMMEAGYIAEDIKGDVRLSVEQSFYILCDSQDVDYVKNSPLYKKYGKFQNIYFNNQVACAGVKTCPFGVIENKSDAIEMAYYLNEQVQLEDGKVRMYWSACPKGCGIHGVADIGFEGCKVKNEEGKSIGGVKVFLGGKASKSAQEARVLSKGVTLDRAQKLVRNLLLIYKDSKRHNETFESFDTRVLSQLTTEELCERIGA